MKTIAKQKGFIIPPEIEKPLDSYLTKVGQKFSDYVNNLIREDLINKNIIKLGGKQNDRTRRGL